MVKRLSELYRMQQGVEILLQYAAGERWTAGTIVSFDFPGLWVRTAEGRLWFVTNGRRIRPARGNEEAPGSDPC